jgi:hypothetical protein
LGILEYEKRNLQRIARTGCARDFKIRLAETPLIIMLAFIKKYQRTILITFIVLVVLFGAFVAFAIYSLGNIFESDTVTPTASQYSEWVGIWLPKDVQNFQAYGEGWQDWLVEAKFEMPASQLSEFLERNKLQPGDSVIGLESNFKLEWFSSTAKLESYTIMPSSEAVPSTPTFFYPSVLLDTSNPEEVRVYIVANTM